MLDELLTWWQNTTPQTQAAVQTIGVLLAALLGGQVVGAMVARGLRARNFDAVLRLPGSAPATAEESHGFTPTLVAGLLVRLTVWTGAAWWMAGRAGRVELADTLGRIVGRTWALAAVLVATLSLGGFLARRLIECVQGSAKTGAEAAAFRGGATGPRGRLAGAVGAGAYGLVVLLALLVMADLFDWPLTRSSALALWQFAQHLLVAGAALLIGGLGARWAREQVTAGGTSPEQRAGQYTSLGIIVATTLLAVAVLLSSAGLLIGLAALAILGTALWLVRGYLPDAVAGLQLRTHNVREVCFEGVAWQVADVGFLTTNICRNGEFCRMQNRVVLDALLQAAPVAANSR
jgi:hypothetical protein